MGSLQHTYRPPVTGTLLLARSINEAVIFPNENKGAQLLGQAWLYGIIWYISVLAYKTTHCYRLIFCVKNSSYMRVCTVYVMDWLPWQPNIFHPVGESRPVNLFSCRPNHCLRPRANSQIPRLLAKDNFGPVLLSKIPYFTE